MHAAAAAWCTDTVTGEAAEACTCVVSRLSRVQLARLWPAGAAAGASAAARAKPACRMEAPHASRCAGVSLKRPLVLGGQGCLGSECGHRSAAVHGAGRLHKAMMQGSIIAARQA